MSFKFNKKKHIYTKDNEEYKSVIITKPRTVIDIKECPVCHKLFNRYRRDAKVCSKYCSTQLWHKRTYTPRNGLIRKCLVCQKEFHTKCHKLYCSQVCSYKASTDRRLSRYSYDKDLRVKVCTISRRSQLKRMGLTEADYDNLVKIQNGLCAICKKPETSSNQHVLQKRLAVDHCHKTGKVRGLLCSKCNRGIGYFNDSTDLLYKAIIYLEGFND